MALTPEDLRSLRAVIRDELEAHANRRLLDSIKAMSNDAPLLSGPATGHLYPNPKMDAIEAQIATLLQEGKALAERVKQLEARIPRPAGPQ